MLLSPSSGRFDAREMAIEPPSDVALERADDLAFGAALPRAPIDVAASAGVVDHDDPPEAWGGNIHPGDPH